MDDQLEEEALLIATTRTFLGTMLLFLNIMREKEVEISHSNLVSVETLTEEITSTVYYYMGINIISTKCE